MFYCFNCFWEGSDEWVGKNLSNILSCPDCGGELHFYDQSLEGVATPEPGDHKDQLVFWIIYLNHQKIENEGAANDPV